MDYKDDLSLYLYLVPIVLSFSFALVLFIKRDRTLPQFYLAINFAVIGVSILLSFAYERYGNSYDEILRPIDSVANALGAFPMMFYCISLMKPLLLTRRFIANFLGLTLLFVLFVALTSGLFKGPVPCSVHEVIGHISSPSILWRLFIVVCIVIVELYVGVYVIRMYLRHRRFIKNSYSYGEGIDLKWLGAVLLLFVCFAFICLLSSIYLNDVIVFLYHAIMLTYIVVIFCMGFRQDAIPVEGLTDEAVEGSEENLISLVQPSDSQTATEKTLTTYFKQQKPYLDPELSLSGTARAIGSNTTYVSNLINRRFNMNFYSFVNSYRIDYATGLIKEADFKLTIDQLYTASGFKSRSVFYKLFRERTGMSPGDYITKRNGDNKQLS